MITENIDRIEERILKACERAGRKRSDVLLICVSKTKPDEMIVEAYDHGQRNFGENKPQEMRDKAARLESLKDINWHMIGSLQKNKIKYVVPTAVLIHSVDSEELALAINKEAEKKNVVSNILLEVNIAGEESKHGFKKEEVLPAVMELAKLKNLKIRGLMTVAPETKKPEENRVYFKDMKDLLVDINSKNIDNIHMDCLSMGMTGDFEIAVEEGATIVRVGTGIFGERNYEV